MSQVNKSRVPMLVKGLGGVAVGLAVAFCWVSPPLLSPSQAAFPEEDPNDLDEAALKKQVEDADKAIKDQKGKPDASPIPYLTKGKALIGLKKHEEALETLLDGLPMLRAAATPDEALRKQFIDALARVNSFRDRTKPAAGGGDMSKEVADLTAQKKLLTDQLTAAQKDLTDTKQTLTTTQDKLTTAEKDLADSKKTLTAVQKDLTDTKQTLATTQKDLTDTKQTLVTTQDKLTTAEKDLADTKKTLTTTQKDLTDAKEALAAAQKDLTAAQKDLADSKQALTLSQTKLAAAEKDLAAAQKEAADAKQAQVKAQQELAAAQKQAADFQAVYVNAQKEVTDLKQTVTTTQVKLTAAEKDLASAQKDAADAKLARDALRKDLAEAQKQQQAAATQLEEAKQALADARKEVERARHGDITASNDVPLNGRARVIVQLPTADARLYVDDVLDPSRGETIREFLTRPLPAGKKFVYTLRAEYVRDGKPMITTKKITFTGNSEQRVSFLGSSDD